MFILNSDFKNIQNIRIFNKFQLYFNEHLSNNYVSAPETTSTINNCSSTSPTSLIFSSTASQQPSNNTVISSNNCYSDTEIPSTNNNISFLLPEEMGSPKQQQLQQQQQQQQRLPPTTSIKKESITTSIATTTNASSSSVPQFSPTSNIENERNLNLAQQKIVDQLLEAGGIFNSLENNLGGGNDELGQLMAQLISGSNNRNETELQAAQLAQHLVAATTGGSGGGGDVLIYS
ncbi:unnamed protein product [Meloidogyne enterolobii]|uniref:Uncharacterized protein n=1 Tax=Meloidogyne enterolobii TaxID=390850 RepID=A0ACB0ZU90_MELEN